MKAIKSICGYSDNKTVGLGLVWENEGKKAVVIDNSIKIDINSGITIVDVETRKEIYIDILGQILQNI
jgi:hypothetical protein